MNRDGNEITNELTISSFDGVEQDKYFLFFGNKMVDPNAIQEVKPQTTPTPEPVVKEKYRLELYPLHERQL